MHQIRLGKLKHSVGSIAQGTFLRENFDDGYDISQHYNFMSKFSPISFEGKVSISGFRIDSTDLESVKPINAPIFTFSELIKLFEKDPELYSKELTIVKIAIENYRNNDDNKVFSYIEKPVKDEVELAYNLLFLTAGTKLQKVKGDYYEVIPVFEDLRTKNIDKIRVCSKYLRRNAELLEGYGRFSKDGLHDLETLPMAGLIRKLKFLTLENEEVKSYIVQLESYYEKSL